MRYIRKKKVLTKLHDEIIDNKEEIYGILEIIREKEISCQVRLSSGPRYDLVRVLKANPDKDECLLCIITEHSSLRKTISVSEIEYLEVITDTEVFVSSKMHKMSRFFMLEPKSID